MLESLLPDAMAATTSSESEFMRMLKQYPEVRRADYRSMFRATSDISSLVPKLGSVRKI